ncbi:membrane protein, putative [Babesia bigemina]|uniref:Membrane protein, putative n=1 Tax=Babesia bigemina TaxID=5866 RepID=A0A061D9D4_BABBI|nr:membrane protein, putative [Babesia bigemina]CDR94305.1 membrane protein, putative [Babesia bigemina]|eukprot:XP_012766491.1 membrane protein, putative [Babesia bigemina]
MYFHAHFKNLLRCLAVVLLLRGASTPAAAEPEYEDAFDYDVVIKRIKDAAHYLTDCTIDQLAQYCTTETALNFECFRTIGRCIPGTLRKVAILGGDKGADEEEEEEEPISESEEL